MMDSFLEGTKQMKHEMAPIHTRLWYEGVLDTYIKTRRESYDLYLKRMGVIVSQEHTAKVDRAFALCREEALGWTLEEAADHFCGRKQMPVSEETAKACKEVVGLLRSMGKRVQWRADK